MGPHYGSAGRDGPPPCAPLGPLIPRCVSSALLIPFGARPNGPLQLSIGAGDLHPPPNPHPLSRSPSPIFRDCALCELSREYAALPTGAPHCVPLASPAS